MRDWYQKNKSRQIALVKGRKKRIKAWAREYKEADGCEACGETHPACLEFHHINPHEKGFSVGRVNDYLSVSLIQREIAKCRLLCANCHRKEHWKQHRDDPGDPSQKEKRVASGEESRRNPFLD